LSAFDPASSERRWHVVTSPLSSPSLANGRLFAIERWPGEHTDRIVSRQLADGTLAWARPIASARGPAPVLAGHLAVVHTREAVAAFDQTSGEPVWSAPLPKTAPETQSATTLAAALGSGTLVVLSGTQVHLLRLDDGTEAWAAAPLPGAKRLEAPVVAGSSLYLVADGRVLRLDGTAREDQGQGR
jgi:outer membrane protein assembly factor BamB